MLSRSTLDPEAIRLPRVFGARDLPAMFRVCEQVRASSGPLVLDGSETNFVDPLGIAVLGALLEPASHQRSVRIEWLPVSVGTYPDRMEVLHRCAIQGVESNCHARNELGDTPVELRVSAPAFPP